MSLFTALLLAIAAAAQAQDLDFREIQGEECPLCREGEIGLRLEAPTPEALDALHQPPCTENMQSRLNDAIAAGELSPPAFVLPARPDARPRGFREWVAALPADLQALPGPLLAPFTSECILMGIFLEPDMEYTGYFLGSISARTGTGICEASPIDCANPMSEYTATPRLIEIDGRRAVVTVFRNHLDYGASEGQVAIAILTVFVRP